MHVAITGASSGIGEALAREFAAAGAHLTLVARRRELLEKLAASVATRTHVVAADLAVPAPALDWLPAAEAALGPLDVLINNAGVQIVAPFDAVDAERAEALLRVDLLTPLRLARAVLPSMMARRAGTIVNVASAAAFSFLPGMVDYDAAKAGLASASETLRAELLGSGVHVVTVYPGPVATAMSDAGYAAYGGRKGLAAILPEGRAEVLARRVRRAVERKSARIVYPRFYWLQRWFPGIARVITDRFAPRPSRPALAAAATTSEPRGGNG